MANGDFFDTFLRNASNYNGGEPEYYEDTHDANGKYVGNSRGNVGGYVTFRRNSRRFSRRNNRLHSLLTFRRKTADTLRRRRVITRRNVPSRV